MTCIDFNALREPNLWSYAALAGISVMTKKATKNQDEQNKKREMLEYLVARTKAKLPNEEINQILSNVLEALKSCSYEVRRITIKAASPALIGGSETFGQIPFEVGLYFHPILNVPYIPGSTIKGAVRSALFSLLYDEKRHAGKSNVEARKEADYECNRILGGRIEDDYGAGLVGFSDAYPIENDEEGYLLLPDVISPHYKTNTASELDVSPTPITFLTVAARTKFQFYLFYKRQRGLGKRQLTIGDSNTSDLAEQPTAETNKLGLLDRAVLYSFFRGVGAKTSVGYSKFEILSYEKV